MTAPACAPAGPHAGVDYRVISLIWITGCVFV
jgi:hypothetical protein